MNMENRFENVNGTEAKINETENCIREGMIQVESLAEDESMQEGLKIFGENRYLSPEIIEKLRVDKNLEIAEA